MPHMKPMMWTIIMMMTTILMMITVIILYQHNMKPPVKKFSQNKKIHMNKW